MEKRGSGAPIGQAPPALATPQQSVGDMVAMTAFIRMSMGVSVVKTLLKKMTWLTLGKLLVKSTSSALKVSSIRFAAIKGFCRA